MLKLRFRMVEAAMGKGVSKIPKPETLGGIAFMCAEVSTRVW